MFSTNSDTLILSRLDELEKTVQHFIQEKSKNSTDIEKNEEKAEPYVFFISHSTKDLESDVGAVRDILEVCKIPSFVAVRDAPVGESLPNEIMKAIRGSEIFLVFLTVNSKKSIWVNQEIGYALGKGKPTIPLKKPRIKIKGLIEASKYILIRDDPIETVNNIFESLKNISISNTAQAAILTFLGSMKLKGYKEAHE